MYLFLAAEHKQESIVQEAAGGTPQAVHS